MESNWKKVMKVDIAYYDDVWKQIKDDALFTVHKKNGAYPNEEWKKNILLSEHSPIRTGRMIINIYNVPSFVITHFVRHNNGIEKFVASFRDDRYVYEDGFVPNRNTLQDFRIDINFQAFINISRKRYCNCASEETRYVWQRIMDKVKEIEPELYWVCVPECIYRGGCPEMFPCKQKAYDGFLAWCKAKGAQPTDLFDMKKRYDLYCEFKDKISKK